LISRWHEPGAGDRRLISLTRGHRMKCLLRRMLDPDEFLSDYGVRSLSKSHAEHPYVLRSEDGSERVVSYDPGESQTNIFGGDALEAEHDRDLYWFHEYFHGDSGAGLGATHQTGWTGLIAKLIQQQGTGGTIVKRDPFTDL